MKIFIEALRSSLMTFTILVAGVVMIATLAGNLIYFLEPANFKSAFDGAWWALVTMSTVGYGDYVPHSIGGRVVASSIMIIGIGLFATITGLISSRIINLAQVYRQGRCRSCHHLIKKDSRFCSFCGIKKP